MNVFFVGRLRMNVVSAAIAGTLISALATGPVAANSMGTQEEREACQPEVFRLCSEFIPDVPKITACLKREVRNLNPACRAVMTGKPIPRVQRPVENTLR